MDYQWDFSGLWQYRDLLLQGLAYTVGFTILTVVSGFFTGLVLALGRRSGRKLVSAPLAIVIEVFRCTPVLVQLVWCYYALPMLIGIEILPATAAFVTLTIYGAAFYAEIIRGGIASIDEGQWDAGRAIGLRHGQVMRLIILPQALRRMLLPLANQSVLQLKNTSLLSVLAVPDLLYQGQLVTSATFRPLETYTLIAVIYLTLLVPVTRLIRGLEDTSR